MNPDIMDMISLLISTYVAGNYHGASKNMKYSFSNRIYSHYCYGDALSADSSIVSICEMNISCQACNDSGQGDCLSAPP